MGNFDRCKSSRKWEKKTNENILIFRDRACIFITLQWSFNFDGSNFGFLSKPPFKDRLDTYLYDLVYITF